MKKYLLSTFGVVPGTLKEVEQYFGTNRPATPFVESTVASWRTDVGMLNSIVHLSTLKDQIYSESEFPNYASKLKAIAPHIVSETHRILAPAPFSPCPSETESKSLCEIRTYRYKRDAIAEVIEKWTLKSTIAWLCRHCYSAVIQTQSQSVNGCIFGLIAPLMKEAELDAWRLIRGYGHPAHLQDSLINKVSWSCRQPKFKLTTMEQWISVSIIQGPSLMVAHQ